MIKKSSIYIHHSEIIVYLHMLFYSVVVVLEPSLFLNHLQKINMVF